MNKAFLGLFGMMVTTASPGGLHAYEPSLARGTVLEAAERLRPGEFLWAPEVAPEGPLLIIVSLATQRAVVYRNGLPIGITTVSTGKPGHETPTGIFTILQKKKDHRSNLYEDAPMPYMQRLTWDGVALHAGKLPGHPASHGCIRLPYRFSLELFGVTRLGATVVVTQRSSLPPIAADGTSLGLEPGAFTGSSVLWQPGKSPAGPISIVMSTTDKRMVVLRNGILIGAAPFSLEGGVGETAAYMLASDGAAGREWLRIPLPGQVPVKRRVGPEERAKFRTPSAFRSALAALVQPGTTVVVTGDSLVRSASGLKVQILASDEHP
jgi:hypothetical protein